MRFTNPAMSASILIIESHPAHRVAIETALAGLVPVVDSVATGDAALVRLGMHAYACVVIGSPVAVDFDGEASTMLELFDRLAPALAGRVVVITNAHASRIIERAAQMNVCAIVTAPFDRDELRHSVARCLGAG